MLWYAPPSSGRRSPLPCQSQPFSVLCKPVTNALCGSTQTRTLEAVSVLDAPTLSPQRAPLSLSRKVGRAGGAPGRRRTPWVCGLRLTEEGTPGAHAVAAPRASTHRPAQRCLGSPAVCAHVLEGSGGRQQSPRGGGGTRGRRRGAPPALGRRPDPCAPRGALATVPECEGPLAANPGFTHLGSCVSGDWGAGRGAPRGAGLLRGGGAGSGAPWGEQAAFRAAHGAPRSAPGGASRGPGITPSFLKRSRSGPAARGRGESEGVGAKSVLGSHRQRVPEGP